MAGASETDASKALLLLHSLLEGDVRGKVRVANKEEQPEALTLASTLLLGSSL